MHVEMLRELYAKLPERHRERWAWEEFKQLSNRKVIEAHGTETIAYDKRQAGEIAARHLPKDLPEGSFGGLAIQYGAPVDTWIPTVVEAGTFKRSVETPSIAERVKIYYNHSAILGGKPLFMKDVPEGLVVAGKPSDTTLGRDVTVMLRDESVDCLSVGFQPQEFFYREDKQGELWRHITDGELEEFSPCARGASAGARITEVHSANGTALAALQGKVELLGARLDEILVLLRDAGTKKADQDAEYRARVAADLEQFESFAKIHGLQ